MITKNLQTGPFDCMRRGVKSQKARNVNLALACSNTVQFFVSTVYLCPPSAGKITHSMIYDPRKLIIYAVKALLLK